MTKMLLENIPFRMELKTNDKENEIINTAGFPVYEGIVSVIDKRKMIMKERMKVKENLFMKEKVYSKM